MLRSGLSHRPGGRTSKGAKRAGKACFLEGRRVPGSIFPLETRDAAGGLEHSALVKSKGSFLCDGKDTKYG